MESKINHIKYLRTFLKPSFITINDKSPNKKNCMSFTSSLPPFGPTGQPFITTERLITGQVKSLMQFILFDLFFLVCFGNNDAPSELQKPDVWPLTFKC